MRRRPLATLTRAAAKWAADVVCTECGRRAWVVRVVAEAFWRHGIESSGLCCDPFGQAEQIALFEFAAVEDEG